VHQAALHPAADRRTRIPYVKLGAHVRIDVRDIDAFIAVGRVTPTNVSSGVSS
jgi:hypothetical protein